MACAPKEKNLDESNANSTYRPGELSNPTNVILIVLDTIRPDHLSVYGYEKKTSPRLDALAEKSLVFTNAYSTTTWTIPAHASLFTGLLPNKSGVGFGGIRLGADRETLAEILLESGYETFAIVSNPSMGSSTGLHQGFQTFLEVWRSEYWRPPSEEFYPEHRRAKGNWPDASASVFFTNEEMIKIRKAATNMKFGSNGDLYAHEKTKEWIENRSSDRPFFLFINLFGAHSPYGSSGPFWNEFLENPGPRLRHEDTLSRMRRLYLGQRPLPSTDTLKTLTALYDAEILHVDYILGKLFDLFEEHGYLENSILVITSDHGENFGDHGHLQHCFALYDSTTRISLIIHAPSFGVKGRRDDRPVQIVDVMPTVLNAIGIREVGAESDGVDLLAPSLPADRTLFLEHRGYGFVREISVSARTPQERDYIRRFDRKLIAVIDDDWKLIVNDLDERELYDLANDPNEEVNLASRPDRADRIARLLGKIEQYRSARVEGNVVTDLGEGVDEETLKALQAIGYLGKTQKAR